MTRSELLKSLKVLVEYHQSFGISAYPSGAEICSSLNEIVEPSPVTPPERIEASEPGTAQAASPVSSMHESPRLDELAEQIAVCTDCALHQGRKISTPGRGGYRPELLVVGDWLAITDQRQPEAGQVFGAEQDVLFWKMMGAIGLGREQVYVTNVIKCSVPASTQPGPEHITVCGNYLIQQIGLLSPRLICAMGPAAAQTLLDTTKSLSVLRGRFHACKLPLARTIQVMPTYHPSYLLKNIEMKRPAWADLQMLQKELDKQRTG